jgi:hypothetical protein
MWLRSGTKLDCSRSKVASALAKGRTLTLRVMFKSMQLLRVSMNLQREVRCSVMNEVSVDIRVMEYSTPSSRTRVQDMVDISRAMAFYTLSVPRRSSAYTAE